MICLFRLTREKTAPRFDVVRNVFEFDLMELLSENCIRSIWGIQQKRITVQRGMLGFRPTSKYLAFHLSVIVKSRVPSGFRPLHGGLSLVCVLLTITQQNTILVKTLEAEGPFCEVKCVSTWGRIRARTENRWRQMANVVGSERVALREFPVEAFQRKM